MRTVLNYYCCCCCSCFLLLLLLTGPAGGVKPSSGFCLGRQCFSLFTDNLATFELADNECERIGGRLMSVRSSAAFDALRSHVSRHQDKVFSHSAAAHDALRPNVSRHHLWIGLHLPSGCPDPTAELRGYRWVAGATGGDDDASDFSHWGATFDSGCSAQRCVAVSTREDYSWTQESCSDRKFGFLCEHSYSDDACTRVDAALGESVTYTTPLGYGGEDLLSVPPGSTATLLPLRTAHICFSGRWMQAPWSCDVLDGGCEHMCASGTHLEPSCYCPEGQSVNPANNVTCQKAQGPCAALRCDHACQRSGDGVYACACDQGFRLARDGRTCVDVNECSDKRHCPAENTRCVNTADGFECVCANGFRAAAGGRCVDTDECATAPCEHRCTNTHGSYRCSCYEGYIAVPEEPHRCQLHCGLEECPAECDPNDGSQCYCPEGYVAEERSSGTYCIDMDECSFFACDQGCKNTYGGHVCSCDRGFTLVDGFRCKKLADEDLDLDGGWEGGGSGDVTHIPGIITASPATQTNSPTRPPSRMSVGVLVATLACVVLVVALLVFLVYYFLGRTESASALKGASEAHGLHRVASDA